MRLQEYLSKKCFAESGIPIPQGEIAKTPEEVYEIARKLGGVIVINPQIPIGRHGRFRSIKLATSPDKAQKLAQEIIGKQIQEITVHSVLVETAADIAQEIYLDISYDRTAGVPVLTISPGTEKGIDNIANINAGLAIREYIDPLLGLRSYQITRAMGSINLPYENWSDFHKIVQALYSCYIQHDALQALINPLVVTNKGELIALDGELTVDDNALYRHNDLLALYNANLGIEIEVLAREADIRHVELDGQIGCIVNGAGVAMALMDMVRLYSNDEARLSNVFDIGSHSKSNKIALALRLILGNTKTKVILLNFFDDITYCDKVAGDVINAYNQTNTNIPLIVRIQGENTEEGHAVIKYANNPSIIIANTLSEAAHKAVNVVKEINQ